MSTYCASPNCVGKCGRLYTKKIREEAEKLNKDVWFSYFCGVPEPTSEVDHDNYDDSK